MNTILSVTFKIAFGGLMLFQGDSSNSKTHVVVIDAPYHAATLILLPSKEEIPIEKGDQISFDLAPGPAKVKDSFDDHVPTLKQHIKKGKVHDDVIDAETANAGILALVSLPKGDLIALRGLPNKVRLEKTTGLTFTKTLCMAKAVILEAETSQEVVVTINRASPVTRTVPMDGAIIIENRAVSSDPHFHYYSRLLNKGGEIGSATILDTTCPDDTVSLAILSSAMIEYLRRLPNGDCGPVDNP